MDDATKLADALRQLIQVIGWWRFLMVVSVLAAAIVIVVIYRGRRTDAGIKAVVDAKNETIERLAEQNRELRLDVFIKGGMPVHDAYYIVYGKKYGGTEKKIGSQIKNGGADAREDRA